MKTLGLSLLLCFLTLQIPVAYAGQPVKEIHSENTHTSHTSHHKEAKRKAKLSERIVRHLIKNKLQKWQRQMATADECDKIVTRDGSIITANIVEITDTEFKYRLCGQPDGPLRVTAKSNVESVTFANGDRVVYPKEKPVSTESNNNGRKTSVNGLSVASFTLSILGLFLLPVIGQVAAIVTGIIALSQIRKKGGRGKVFAILGIAISIATFLVVAALLAVFL